MSYTKGVRVINDLNDVDTATTVPTNGDFLVFNGTNWVPNNVLPVAKITRTSKISNRLTVNASSSSATLSGDTLTYLWTIVPSAGVTIATPTAVSTNIICPSGSGEYTLTLTVTSVATGLTASDTYEFKTNRIIEVQGVNEENNDLFTTLLAANTWITTNDAVNVSDYEIKIMGQTADAARIVPLDSAKVHFSKTGQLLVGVDFGVGSFEWSGEELFISGHIRATVGAGMTLVANSNVYASNLSIISTADNAITVVSGNLNTRDCFILCTAAGFSGIRATNAVGFVLLRDQIFGMVAAVFATNCRLRIERSEITGAVNTASGLLLLECQGAVNHNRIQLDIAGANSSFQALYLKSTVQTITLTITDNIFKTVGISVGGALRGVLYTEGSALNENIISNNVFDADSDIPCAIFHNSSNSRFHINNNFFRTNLGTVDTLTTTSSTIAVIPVALSMNMFNNIIRGLVNVTLTPLAGVALASENMRY